MLPNTWASEALRILEREGETASVNFFGMKSEALVAIQPIFTAVVVAVIRRWGHRKKRRWMQIKHFWWFEWNEWTCAYVAYLFCIIIICKFACFRYCCLTIYGRSTNVNMKLSHSVYVCVCVCCSDDIPSIYCTFGLYNNTTIFILLYIIQYKYIQNMVQSYSIFTTAFRIQGATRATRTSKRRKKRENVMEMEENAGSEQWTRTKCHFPCIAWICDVCILSVLKGFSLFRSNPNAVKLKTKHVDVAPK